MASIGSVGNLFGRLRPVRAVPRNESPDSAPLVTQTAGIATKIAADDFGVPQIVTIWVRWFLILTWLVLINYRPDSGRTLYLLDGMGSFMLAVNAVLHWRIYRHGSVSRGLVQTVGFFDIAIITAGIAITTRFDNNFFVAYYPALLYLSLLVDSGRWNILIAAAAASAYAYVAVSMGPGIYVSAVFDGAGEIVEPGKEEKILIFRIACMFAVVAAGYAVPHVERKRRMEAVERARRAAEEVRLAQARAEQAAEDERREIRSEIHDGVAQSVRALGLKVESIVDSPVEDGRTIKNQLAGLAPTVRRTLDEIYEYLYDIEPILSGDTNLELAIKRRLEESTRYFNLPSSLEIRGQRRPVPVRVSRELIRILQEAVTNAARHARASEVRVALVFEPSVLELRVSDNGVGFDPEGGGHGIGLESMRSRADKLSGELRVESRAGSGTDVRVRVPLEGRSDGHHQANAGR